MQLSNLVKAIIQIGAAVEKAQALYRALRFKWASRKANQGDQRELEKTFGDEPAPSSDPGVFRRPKKNRTD